jgi:hypothetical protein
MLDPRFGGMLIANRSDGTDLPYAPKRLSRNIGTAGMVTQVFREEFFAPVRIREARLDRYLRNGEPPNRVFFII